MLSLYLVCEGVHIEYGENTYPTHSIVKCEVILHVLELVEQVHKCHVVKASDGDERLVASRID